jgi:hypothetical protein
MMNKTLTVRFLNYIFAASLIALAFGIVEEVSAQRDPFVKPAFARERVQRGGSSSGTQKAPAEITRNGPPAIEQRIEYYKRQREQAAINGQPLPKVTSVLTLDEMAVTGIFKTPRGYAAMVEATPIKLSYTIYPGEKFFDGQLVAVEENRLVFRKVTKMSNGKFIASVENKALRQYTTKSQIEGTAPVQTAEATDVIPAYQPPAGETAAPVVSTAAIISPLDEMSQQKNEPDSAKSTKSAKKKARTAKKN